jgi:phage gpG-like protein
MLTVAQLPGYLRKVADDLKAEAPVRAVHAMGDAYTRVVVASMKGSSPSAPGTPPARRTGTLARSIRTGATTRSGPYIATISVAPHTVYARIQQLGGDIYPRHTLGAAPPSTISDKELSALRLSAAQGRKGAAEKYQAALQDRYGSRRSNVPYGPIRYSDLGYLRWESGGQVHYSRHVYLPPRPYMVMSPEARTACHDAAKQAAEALFKTAE